MRFRYWYMVVGSLVVTLMHLLSDPDIGVIQGLAVGAGTVASLLILSKSIIYVALLFMSSKALMDYNEADSKALFKKSSTTASGAGMALIGKGLVFVALAITIVAATMH